MEFANYQVFLIGCVGAIAPEILRLYNLRDNLKFNFSWSYLVISFAFVLLGGFISSILEPSNNYAAFYSGVSTPLIINTIAKQAQTENISPPATPTEEDITRKGKGISEQQEQKILNEANKDLQKMSLKNFWRAL